MTAPNELIPHIQGVGLLSDYQVGSVSRHIPADQDISFFLLEIFPQGVIVDEDLPTWPAELSRRQYSTAGKFTSCNVLGKNVTFNSKEGVFKCILDSGEPGNSGTLMHALPENGPPERGHPIGVFLGFDPKVAAENKEKKWHGLICPLPAFDEFRVHHRFAHLPSD